MAPACICTGTVCVQHTFRPCQLRSDSRAALQFGRRAAAGPWFILRARQCAMQKQCRNPAVRRGSAASWQTRAAAAHWPCCGSNRSGTAMMMLLAMPHLHQVARSQLHLQRLRRNVESIPLGHGFSELDQPGSKGRLSVRNGHGAPRCICGAVRVSIRARRFGPETPRLGHAETALWPRCFFVEAALQPVMRPLCGSCAALRFAAILAVRIRSARMAGARLAVRAASWRHARRGSQHALHGQIATSENNCETARGDRLKPIQ